MTANTNFRDKLATAVRQNDSLVCVGLDTDPGQIPPGVSVTDFNREIIAATAGLVCAYKINLAFYEAQGSAGYAALEQAIKDVPASVPVIADAKRGDIGNTARAYASAVFEVLGCDAVTVSPYLGGDSLEPFLDYADRGVFILCRTSNPGGSDFQSLMVDYEGQKLPLYQVVARKSGDWNRHANIGLVVGATAPEELAEVRRIQPEMPLLVPGIGAQGGDLEATLRHGLRADHAGVIINSSRGIIFASKGADFADAARRAADDLRNQINLLRHTA
jgi:orotidine-5'-phosphate decarboxylase